LRRVPVDNEKVVTTDALIESKTAVKEKATK